jgi:hypothetical protein
MLLFWRKPSPVFGQDSSAHLRRYLREILVPLSYARKAFVVDFERTDNTASELLNFFACTSWGDWKGRRHSIRPHASHGFDSSLHRGTSGKAIIHEHHGFSPYIKGWAIRISQAPLSLSKLQFSVLMQSVQSV